ncbi:predicted protein [Sclerotinia sclerotiorum 1980 UF-70]|uniref:Uncharacterized protein n=1 Tax=Sclerotinia sclerotiorum (strain ATCC 18683 / 1980 / Ss-1) TaxID=665079 RepID=A7EAB0_SCLS1|nr:predicted protein [Sclerotinia sclerotiorum 1980 UF-70]EDN99388.1 predicted protein [Sclerotinia sclerotiorum 1980 UF-70]
MTAINIAKIKSIRRLFEIQSIVILVKYVVSRVAVVVVVIVGEEVGWLVMLKVVEVVGWMWLKISPEVLLGLHEEDTYS